MARFYFHIRDGEAVIADDEGLELPDVEAARYETRASAIQMLREAQRSGDDIAHQIIEVKDHVGRLLMQVALEDLLD